jgi:transcriptional regulator with XRE-family HTH domain
MWLQGGANADTLCITFASFWREERENVTLHKNEFGALVQVYRKQRGWTQGELAERWGHTRGYVSQVESGRRKLDSTEQLVRLADILDIPQEKLEAIGRGIPTRKIQAEHPSQADDAILQMLLEPSRDMVKMAWLTWFADAAPSIEERLRELTFKLDTSLTVYHGSFVKPAQQLLAYSHQMMGKIAFDRLDYAAAGGHFSEMIELGRELNDADIITAGMSHQGDLLRKRGRYETALRCFEQAAPFAAAASLSVRGMRNLLMARAYSIHGELAHFERSIDAALIIARDNPHDTLDNLTNQSSLVEVLQEQAQGYTMLWKPEKALDIYRETDRLRPFRPLRDLGSYNIVKAQAYAYGGDLNTGLDYSLKGLELTALYRSKRHVARLEGMYNRLRVTRMGKDKRLKEIGEAIGEVKRKQEEW